jgi:hypothetical protein
MHVCMICPFLASRSDRVTARVSMPASASASANALICCIIKSVHVKTKRFRCKKCPYTNCNLQSHVKHVHEKEREFKCDKCTYRKPGDMSMHIKSVHDKIKDN